MKKITSLFILSLLTTHLLWAQDTTVVQTLNFNDITKRRGWYVFPSDTISYRKILMYYTLKCDAATTQDGYPCGEWDYTTYTNLYQHQNVGSPRYLLNGTYPDTINYVTSPTYNKFQDYNYFIVYDNVISETDDTVGIDTTPITQTFQSTDASGKAQYLWRSSELTTAGLSAGSIDKLKLDFSALGSNLNNLTIRMKNTSLFELSDTLYETNGFTTVYDNNTSIGTTGINTFNLTTPYIWDGTSNIIVEFCFSNNNPGTNNTVLSETTAYNSGVYASKDDGALDFVWGDYVEVPATALTAIDSFITVSFWSYGDISRMPENAYAFEGRDANGYRVINCHLPWSNGQVYWDAGNSGTSSYDRINQLADTSNYAGKWNHWALVKDVSTSEMKIYLNGSLWLTGTGLTKTMSSITNFRIAAPALDNGKYDGLIHDFRIWNIALDSTTIQQWMYKDVNLTHPYYSNLQAYYKFDDMSGAIAMDSSGNYVSGNLIGMPSWQYINGCDLYRNMNTTTQRPNIIFTQGSYLSHIDSVLVTDSVMNPGVSIIQYSTSVDTNNSGITMTSIDTTYGWESGWTYTYGPNGNAIDSSFVNFDNQLVNLYTQNTFQLQNYVTPYGIGLNLGINGFRWVYDVTDYTPLLHDTVEISAGNQQELIDLKFVMIKGTPPRAVLDVQSIWLGDYQHADIANDVVMPAVDINLNPLASSYRIKTRTSGHWFGGYQNCAEFCPKNHNVVVDGIKQFEWLNWKECAINPVVAQGGTWIYNRAAWCPGSFTDTYDHELTPYVTPGATVSLDYGMDYTAGGMEGNYRVTMQLVSYGANNYNLDAAVDEIISPNNWEYYNRVNPICADPKIVIQNTGTTTLTSLTITFNVLGGAPETYNWTGSLAFLEKEEVTLPIATQTFWNTTSLLDVFEVNVSAPNGGVDEYAANDNAHSTFEKPDVYSGTFFMRIHTNLAAYENSYTIKDDQGNVVMSRTGMTNSTYYNDTINLPDGCYVLDFLDSDDDGLSFFANSDGAGYIRFMPDPPGWIKTFESEFGRFIKYYFVIDNSTGVNTYNKQYNIDVYPNPSHDIFNVAILGYQDGAVEIEVYNILGDLFQAKTIHSENGVLETTFDLSQVTKGVYIIKIKSKESVVVKQIIKE